MLDPVIWIYKVTSLGLPFTLVQTAEMLRKQNPLLNSLQALQRVLCILLCIVTPQKRKHVAYATPSKEPPIILPVLRFLHLQIKSSHPSLNHFLVDNCWLTAGLQTLRGQIPSFFEVLPDLIGILRPSDPAVSLGSWTEHTGYHWKFMHATFTLSNPM